MPANLPSRNCRRDTGLLIIVHVQLAADANGSPWPAAQQKALNDLRALATKVADAHRKEATIERFVKARGAATVYVDYLQNIQGKTVAGPYCVRAKAGATSGALQSAAGAGGGAGAAGAED